MLLAITQDRIHFQTYLTSGLLQALHMYSRSLDRLFSSKQPAKILFHQLSDQPGGRDARELARPDSPSRLDDEQYNVR